MGSHLKKGFKDIWILLQTWVLIIQDIKLIYLSSKHEIFIHITYLKFFKICFSNFYKLLTMYTYWSIKVCSDICLAPSVAPCPVEVLIYCSLFLHKWEWSFFIEPCILEAVYMIHLKYLCVCFCCSIFHPHPVLPR